MREHKYRAWDRKKNRMLEVGRIDFVQEEIEVYYENYRHPLDFENIFLEQFTGRKDKNGKEIWEGDRISFWAEDSPSQLEGVVEYDNDDAAFRVIDEKSGCVYYFWQMGKIEIEEKK